MATDDEEATRSKGRVAMPGSARRDYAGLLVAGGIPALVGVPALVLLAGEGLPVLWANVIVLAASSAFTFCFSFWVVFGYRDVPLPRALARFAVAVTATSLADIAVVALLAASLPREASSLVLAKGCGIAAGLLARLLLMRAWAFAVPAGDEPSGPLRPPP